MTFRQVVDLAARFSAVVLRDESGEVIGQYDSRDKSPFSFAAEIARHALNPECEATFIEEVPFNPRYTQTMVKPVFKLQGIIMMASWKTIDRTFMVNPSTWMSRFPGVQRAPKGMTKAQGDQARIDAAADHARQHGYTPPDLVAAWVAAHPELKPLKKYTNDLVKSKTDYVSAWLISEYLSAYNMSDFPFQGVEPAHI